MNRGLEGGMPLPKQSPEEQAETKRAVDNFIEETRAKYAIFKAALNSATDLSDIAEAMKSYQVWGIGGMKLIHWNEDGSTTATDADGQIPVIGNLAKSKVIDGIPVISEFQFDLLRNIEDPDVLAALDRVLDLETMKKARETGEGRKVHHVLGFLPENMMRLVYRSDSDNTPDDTEEVSEDEYDSQ